MRKVIFIFFVFYSFGVIPQTNYSNRWEDFFSYTNVKDFITVNNIIYAIADNAIFTYDLESKNINKQSSVHGLSGQTTKVIHYNQTFKRIVVGYENGLVEVIDQDGTIIISKDIVNFNQSGKKEINSIYEYNNKLYLGTSFGIVVYDIENLEFGDTYFIGPASSSVEVSQITVFNNLIYAATNSGLYVADINNPNLIDFNNWSLLFAGNYQNIIYFNNRVYAVSGKNVEEINGNIKRTVLTFSENILDIKSNTDKLVISLSKRALLYNISFLQEDEVKSTNDINFKLNTASFVDGKLFLGTSTYGILYVNAQKTSGFEEIHPDGPINNSPFSITAKNGNLWVVYGGYDEIYAPKGNRQGFSHFIEGEWKNTHFNPDFPVTDLNYVTINPLDDKHVFLSSMGSTTNTNSVSTGGLLEIKDDKIVNFYNHLNSDLEDILPNNNNVVTIRITGTIFDNQGNLWVNNIGVDNRLKKRSASGQWSSFNLSDLFINNAYGMNEIVQDNFSNFWIGTRRNGVYIFNEKQGLKKSLTTEPTKGSLPNLNVRTVAVDKNNHIWLGTLTGLVVFKDASQVFDKEVYDAEPIIILDDGIAKKLLGDQTVNSIAIDGANNKWFGTENSGVLYTNPDGQKTLAVFNQDNSPLPSNKILKISVDESTGKVYFATDKGIVVYNSKVASFGEDLQEVYAYPNPVLSKHDFVTIDGRNGTHLPKGTNVKILDVQGNLVYETNIVEGQQLEGGKVVWNKRNLAGNKVASGIYIVLLSKDDASQNATTKIAIIN